MLNRLTFGGVFAKLNWNCSKVMIVNISWAVSVEKLKYDPISLQIVIAWHLIWLYRAISAHHRVICVQLHSVALFILHVIISLRLKRLIYEGFTNIIMQHICACTIFLVNFLDQIVLSLFLVFSQDVTIDSLNTCLVCLDGAEGVVVRRWLWFLFPRYILENEHGSHIVHRFRNWFFRFKRWLWPINTLFNFLIHFNY